MWKNAYVRGIQTALVNSGHAAYPDKSTADKVADYIADHNDIDLSQEVPRALDQKIATQLLEATKWLVDKTPNFKAAAFNKLSSWEDVGKLAELNATQLMEKAAEGSTIEGGDKGNHEPTSGEGKMDTAERPPGYAEDSRGETEVDTKPGAVGKEEDQPKKPSETDSKPNSVTEQSKTSSLANLFRKAAEGTTILGGDKGNKEPISAEAKMEASLRPPGYAVLPTQGALGEMMKLVTGPAVVGKEIAQPVQPSVSPSGSNSVMQHSAKAAGEDPYLALFKKTAAEVHEYLPQMMTEDAKVATVRACMGLTTAEKYHYLTGLQKEAAIHTAGMPAEVPPGSRSDKYTNHSPEATHGRPGAYDGRSTNQGSKTAEGFPPFMKKDEEKKDDEKKDEGEKKDDDGGEKKHLPPWLQGKIDDKKDDSEKKDDKKDDEKKEASLHDMFRRIVQAQRA